MAAHIYTVAFQGIEAREVDVQVHVASQTSINNPFSIVGLADKAVAESRERVRAALWKCGGDYQARLSGPLLDRIDIHVEVNSVSAQEFYRCHRRRKEP